MNDVSAATATAISAASTSKAVACLEPRIAGEGTSARAGRRQLRSGASPARRSALRGMGAPPDRYPVGRDNPVSCSGDRGDARGRPGGPRDPPRAERIDLLVALTVSDLRARYGRGSWKSLKWLLDPFFATGVYLILVTFVIDRPGEAPGLSIACATVPFQLVIASAVNGLGSVQLRHSIVLNARFDRTLIPLSGVITETIAFGSALLLLAVMMAVYGIAPSARDPLAAGRDAASPCSSPSQSPTRRL